jgi:hypothetical protein
VEAPGNVRVGGVGFNAGDKVMETAREVLRTLTLRYAFGDVAALAADGIGGLAADRAAEVRLLCSFGQRLLDLDAEDFGVREVTGDPIVDAHLVPRDLLKRARASRMPQSPREQPRCALDSLRPAYRLLLEVIDIRWQRREMAALVAAVHIASEYLPLLAWEPVLGHAGDPARLGASVSGPGSRFGVPLVQGQPRCCDLTRPQNAAAERALRVAGEPAPGWRAYLDRQHSHIADALGVCAATCRTPCDVVTRIDPPVREDLAERCKLALDFGDGALVRLRHAAPVGHGFGVPSPAEVDEAWDRTRTSLSHHRIGEKALADSAADPYPLPGLAAIISAAAAFPIEADTLLRDTAERIAALLES